jgi:signal transduction histidine kinase
LTALYGTLFLACCAGLLAITYVLVKQAYGGNFFIHVSGSASGFIASGGKQTRNVVISGAAGGPLPIGLGTSAPTAQQVTALAHRDTTAALGALFVQSVIALAIMTVIAIGLGWIVAGRVLRPLRTMTATTRQISEQNLHQRLSLSGPDDELKQLATTIDELLERLETSFEAQRQFVANASHELRTPLTVISGYLDTLADDSSIDAAWAGPIRDMRAQARRMNAIITDLLELSRLESTDGEAPREPIDVPRMLERLHRDALAKNDRPRHVLLELESADGLYGAAHELESAFTNVLVNALKYTLPDGTVRMRWRTDDDGAYFSVIDTGIGIPAEHIPRLTERFYRVDAGRSRGEGGSGLGLAIVKHALQRHGGWLDVESTEGNGSTFTCHFPTPRICELAVRAAASA